MENNQERIIGYANNFVDFVNASPTPFHAVDTAKKLLSDAGFEHLKETEEWNLKNGQKYFFTRNQTSIVAFYLPEKFKSGNGFNVAGAHTDSPNLRIKPNFTTVSEGYFQVGIEPYGGGLWHTWFDRDLGVAGRVIVRQNDTFVPKLVNIPHPILRVPTLAIHLDRESGTKFEFNKQEHLKPVLATTMLSGGVENPLLALIASEAKCNTTDIVDQELHLYDLNKSTIGGLNKEFIFSARLDNLMMSFASLTALIEATKDVSSLKDEENLLGVCLFDHEEVGSESAQGAASPILNELFRRVTNNPSLTERAIRKSFFISADMAHAVHPNYSGKHEPNHKPQMHKGPVIKRNANQRYATTSETGFILRQLAERNNIPVQEFVVRNDSLCGSTIGPILAGHVGIRTVDIGNPQLSMHSIREQCGTVDVTHAIDLLRAFYQQFTKLDASFLKDE